MLHELLVLNRPLIVFDLETTSLDIQKARIIEISFQMFTAEGLKKNWTSLVDPEILILNSASHHITDEDIKGKPTFKQLAESIARGFKDCDYGGKNIRYDLQVIASEMNRVGQKWSYTGARVICADRLEQLGEPRTLSHLYEKPFHKKALP